MAECLRAMSWSGRLGCACWVVARVSCFFIRAHCVLVSHPLCMRDALGSMPIVSIVSLLCPATPHCVVVARVTAHGQDSLAEWSKALAQGASPQGRGFEPHSCHLQITRYVDKREICKTTTKVHKQNLDTLGIEPRASRMLSGCDTTTPCARSLRTCGFATSAMCKRKPRLTQ